MKRNSWHFKMTSFWFSDYKWENHVNLCPYVRAFLASIAISCFFMSGTAFIAYVFGYCMVAALLPFLFTAVSLDMSIIGGILWAVTAFTVWKISREIKPKWDKVVYTPKPKQYVYVEPKEPNFLVLYLKALHDKVCPRITLED